KAASGGGLNLHLVNAGAGVTVNGTTNWTGAGGRIYNATASALTVTVTGTLNSDFAFSSSGSNPNFIFAGGGTARLSSIANTGNLTFAGGTLVSSDLSSGAGNFGTLGTGTITLNTCLLVYDGSTATSAKPLTLMNGGAIQ